MSGFVSGFFDVRLLICFFRCSAFIAAAFGRLADVPTFLDRLKKKAVSAKILFGQPDVNEFVYS